MVTRIYLITTAIFGTLGAAADVAERASILSQVAHNLVDDHPDMHVGIHAVSLAHDAELCAINERRHFIPASNTKLFTAVLALEQLGPDFQFITSLVTDGTIDQSVLHGSVWLRAAGDPSLQEGQLAVLIEALREHGISEITDNFCVDTTAFEGDLFQPGSFIDNIGYGWNAPATALSVNGKAAHLKMPRGGALVDDDKIRATAYDLRATLHAMLDAAGIKLHGALKMKQSPVGAYVLAECASEPLSVLLKHMMSTSDNLYADALFKKVGEVVSGAAGSWETGKAALQQMLTRMGINPRELVVIDGAGRSRYNLIAPAHLTAVLRWAYTQPYFPVLFNSFSIAGVDGSLKNRMTHLSGQIRGKTGTLSGVSALCGYVSLPDDLIVFSVMENGFISESAYNAPCKCEVEDALCCAFVSMEHGVPLA